MARDIGKRLSQLRSRRTGTDRLNKVAAFAADELSSKAKVVENWQTRTQKPYTRYALGSMEEVGSDYTRISMDTAKRVGKQLHDKLTAQGMLIDFRLQGSVPLNVHIRGVSDVDLLTIDDSMITYANSGPRARAGLYNSPTTKTSLGVLTALRSESEKILKSQYPAATVDTSGGKAISISGGSLARQDCDRGITILNKKVPTTIDNWPFLHIKRIGDRDGLALGGLKKAIRLSKNVKNDAIEEGHRLNLPSFDIAALLYHADLGNLKVGLYFELCILAETQRFLDYLTTNEAAATQLSTPDGSRKVLDSQEKLDGLRRLSLEMDDLLKEVAAEHAPYITGASIGLADARRIIQIVMIPAAA